MKVKHWVKWAGLLPLVFVGVFNLVFAAIDIASGVYSGGMHLLLVILPAILGYLAWKWPFGGGSLLAVVGIIFIIKFIVSMEKPQDELIGSLLLATPFLLAGIFFIINGANARRNASNRI